MDMFETIQGTVTGPNSIQSGMNTIRCWTNAMQAGVAPQPLDLSTHQGKVVLVKGRLQGDLWEAQLEKVVGDAGYQEISGKVTAFNEIDTERIKISCFSNSASQCSWYLPLNLSRYMGKKNYRGG